MTKYKRFLSINYFFWIGLFILPFVYCPKAVIPYEIPRVWFFIGWVEIMVLIALSRDQIRKGNLNRKLAFLTLTLFPIALISSILGTDFNKSLVGNYYRSDGLVTLVHLIAFSIAAFLYFGRKTFEKVPHFIFWGSSLVSMLAILDNFRLNILNDLAIHNFYGIVGSTFGQPVFLAGYLLTTLPFGMYLYKVSDGKLRKIYTALIVLQALTILLTRSWGASLGLIVIVVCWIFYFGRRHRGVYLGLFSILFVLGSLVFLVVQRRIIENLPNKFIAESRVRIYTKGFLAFTKRPILGWGWANFEFGLTCPRAWAIMQYQRIVTVGV